MNRKYSVFAWLILVLTSCNKTKVSSGDAGVDVYIVGAGSLNTASPTQGGRYWKNHEQFDLSSSTMSDFGVQEYAAGIAVAGNDVYICGNGTGGRNAQADLYSIAKYWKNGISVNLTNGKTVAWATAIGIAGADVYVTGYESAEDLQQNFGKYWKNGVGVILPGLANPTGIAISGQDVYISGIIRDSLTGQGTAVYWKNEIPVRLSDGSSDAQANAILVYGSDIYVAGYDGNRAVYWKNQVPVYLTDGSTTGTLRSIAVEGTDVVVAGQEGSVATYWKNGIPVTLGEYTDLSGIAIADGNTYVVGNISVSFGPTTPGYWINDVREMIFDSTSSSSTSQILAIKR